MLNKIYIKLPVTVFLMVLALMTSCKRSGQQEDTNEPEGRTPVTITHPKKGMLTDAIKLNAISSFLLKTSVKSDLNGFLDKVDIRLGQEVNKGQQLFVIRSKEAEHLGNTISKLDSVFRFNGRVAIKSPADGYITQLAFSPGDYVQDGETLATISNRNSLVFLLNVPYELTPYLASNRHPELILPDGRYLQGTLESSLPAVDPASQTQNYMIRIGKSINIPENLIASVNFIKSSKDNVITLPREALLTNESQDAWWIMKMINSATAVKVPVTRGIETKDRVEIVSPELSINDTILLTGNYGLPDTAKVIIEKGK